MVIYITHNQKCENFRNIFRLAHERNETLVHYSRITDGAIWGFIGLVTIELFKDGSNFKSVKIAIFCIILMASMYLWRNRINLYHKSILEGYQRMVKCENFLHIPDEITIRKNLESYIQKNPLITNKPKNIDDLCALLTPEKYKHPGHLEADFCAHIILVTAFFVLILWGFFWLYHIPNFFNYYFPSIIILYIFLLIYMVDIAISIYTEIGNPGNI
jgi:hypothetical protein